MVLSFIVWDQYKSNWETGATFRIHPNGESIANLNETLVVKRLHVEYEKQTCSSSYFVDNSEIVKIVYNMLRFRIPD